jgi:hypothetical protein
MNSEYNTETIELDIEKIEEKEKLMYQISDQIHYLYNDIIKNHMYEDIVYNPNILANLTEQQFFEWIVCNNDEIAELFNY